jgi:hypothetical protein
MHMQPMGMPQEEGMQLDPDILIATQNNFIASARVKEVQMEAAIQQLRAENYQLRQSLAARDEVVSVDEPAEEESA